MTSDEALRDIRGYASAGRVFVVDHARKRMRERGTVFGDVRNALTNAAGCTGQANGRWRAWGPDRDGDELVCVVELENGVLVVTVF